MAGDDGDNWELLTNNNVRVGTNTSPLHYRLENDKINNEIRTYFSADTISEVSCSYWTIFDTDSGNNWIIPFTSDNGKIRLEQFDISVTCEV